MTTGLFHLASLQVDWWHTCTYLVKHICLAVGKWWGALSHLAEKELEQLYFVATGLGPRLHVKDLICNTKEELWLVCHFVVQFVFFSETCWNNTSPSLVTLMKFNLFSGKSFELRKSRVVDCYRRLDTKAGGKRLEQLYEACLPGLGKMGLVFSACALALSNVASSKPMNVFVGTCHPQEDFKNLDSYASQLGWYALFAKKDKKKPLLNCNGSGKLIKECSCLGPQLTTSCVCLCIQGQSSSPKRPWILQSSSILLRGGS